MGSERHRGEPSPNQAAAPPTMELRATLRKLETTRKGVWRTVSSTMRSTKQSMRAVRRPLAIFGAIACMVAVLSLGAGSATAAQRTTQPGVVQPVDVTLTNTAIVIPKDRYVLNGMTRYPRGSIIDFLLRNHGSVAESVLLKAPVLHFVGASQFSNVASAGKPIPPGTSRHFRISFFFRGTFALEMLVDGKVRATKLVTVF